MSRAFIFPGQGSQFVGMGKDLFDAEAKARLVFEEVDDALGAHLSKIIFEGPEDDLRLTENTQPALMAVSMATVRVLEDRIGPLESPEVWHHVGVYAYRPKALAAYGSWPEGPLEKAEGLEQLRFLENGWPITCVPVEGRGRVFWELNNPIDVERIEAVLKQEGLS